jgi:hypothetical protein
MSWTFTESINPDGYGVFYIHAWRKKSDTPVDVTFFRDVPALIDSMTYADPFGDATAVIRFPQITGFDGPYSDPPTNTVPTDTVWLQEFTNIDITWVPAEPEVSAYPVLHPLTNSYGLYLHPEYSVKVWEGFIETIDPSVTGVTVQCKGALYQLDRYFAKPLNPLRPKLVEEMIERYFDPRRRGLWTQPLEIDFTGWTKTYEMVDYNKFLTDNYNSIRYVPTGFTIQHSHNVTTFIQQLGDKYAAQIGHEWTGYVTRNTGSWERVLTGYIQGMLGILWAAPADGDNLSGGDQWTITKLAGRKPLMYVRRQAKEETLVAWYGQPGIDARITRDGAQNNNVVYGIGKAYSESEWSTFVQPKGSWTTWRPLAYEGTVWHGDDNAWNILRDDNSTIYSDLYDGYDAEYERSNGIAITERFSNFPDGVSLEDGQKIAAKWIDRDSDPGWIR